MYQKNLLLIMTTLITSIFLFYGGLNAAFSASGDNFSANLDGAQEVPPVTAEGTGIASLQMQDNTITYQVNVVNTDKITGIHIHKGTSGENGDVLVSLYTRDTDRDDISSLPKNIEPKIDVASTVQRSSQFSSRGNFHDYDLQGSLEGKTLEDLVSLMQSGQTYVNVHTTSYPDGEIRGQISSK
jgi:hypothetical protein